MIQKGKKNVYRIVNRAVRAYKHAGIKLDRLWGLQINPETQRYELCDSCGCPMALVMCGKKADPRCADYESAAARVLGKPRAWVTAFINGFDGDSFKYMDDKVKAHKDAFNFGRRLANKHIKETTSNA